MTLDMFIRIQIGHNDEKTMHSSVGPVNYFMHEKYIVNWDIETSCTVQKYNQIFAECKQINCEKKYIQL